MTSSHDEQEVAIEQRFVAKAKDINEDIAWAQINEDVLRSLERPRPLFWVIFLASGVVRFRRLLQVISINGPHSTSNRVSH
jgi:hypothetical protein